MRILFSFTTLPFSTTCAYSLPLFSLSNTVITILSQYSESAGFPDSSVGKETTCNAGDLVQFLGQEDPLEKGMATHSSILAWRIP